MANTNRVVRQGKTGATGRRGSQGARGVTGPKGRRGDSGKPGPKGLRGLRGPLHQDDVLERVVTHFDDVYQQLSGHLRRIGKMQCELDGLTATVATLSPSDCATRDVK
jgi:hypothetical protein